MSSSVRPPRAGGPARTPRAAPGEGRFGIRARLAGVAALLVALPFTLLLFLVQDRWTPLLEVDDGARDDLNGFATAHGWFVSLMRTLSVVGSAVVYVPVFVGIAAWLVWRRRSYLAAFVLVTTLGSSVLNTAVKSVVHRSRPVLAHPVAHANGLSFPSGHAQSAMVSYAVLLIVFFPALRGPARPLAVAAAAGMVLAIGFSRVALGVHYVSDVLAGYVLGAAWVVAMAAVFRAWPVRHGPGP